MKPGKSSTLACALLAVVAAVMFGCSRAPEADLTTPALVDIVSKDEKYAGWVKIECLQFMVEQQNEKQTEIAMREKHGNGCPGDPATSPVIDRFIVERTSGNILRYDIVEDQYLQVGSIRKP